MNKELEFFRKIKASILKQFTLGGIYKFDELNKIEKALTPPTVDELCKALSEFTGWEVKYNLVTKEFEYYNEDILLGYLTETYGDGTWTLGAYLSPNLITLIGRFYEGLE